MSPDAAPLHAPAIFLGMLDGQAVAECPHCHHRLRIPPSCRPRRPVRPRVQAAVPQKTIRFHEQEDRELAARIEDRARLEKTTISRLACRLLRLGFQADPHLHTPSREADP